MSYRVLGAVGIGLGVVAMMLDHWGHSGLASASFIAGLSLLVCAFAGEVFLSSRLMPGEGFLRKLPLRIAVVGLLVAAIGVLRGAYAVQDSITFWLFHIGGAVFLAGAIANFALPSKVQDRKP